MFTFALGRNVMSKILWFIAVIFVADFAEAKINVVTTTTDIGWAVKKIGGEQVEVNALLKGHEDPHYVDAVPSFILMAANADVLCSIGLDLEIGWLPRVLERSGNRKIQAGGSGDCELGRGIKPKDVPTAAVDRSMGHVHAKGNPHFWLSPLVFSNAIEQIVLTLTRVDPEHAALYRKRYQSLKTEMLSLDTQLKKMMTTSTLRAMEYHEEFAYFLDALGLQSYGPLEEKPGLPPSAARLANIALRTRSEKIDIILATNTTPKSILNKFKELSGRIKPVVSQISLAGVDDDYRKMLLSLVEKMLASKSVSKENKTNHDIHKG